jgi:hypothetical protein
VVPAVGAGAARRAKVGRRHVGRGERVDLVLVSRLVFLPL